MIGKIGTGTVFPLLGQSIARYEVRNALPFYDARKWENGTCPYFPTYLQVAGFLLDGVVFAQDLA